MLQHEEYVAQIVSAAVGKRRGAFLVLQGAMTGHVLEVFQAFRVDDLPIESGMLTDALDNAQRKVEAYFFNIRKQLWEYDQVLNTQRDRIYAERRKALLATDLSDLMLEYSEETMNDILEVRVALWCRSNIPQLVTTCFPGITPNK